MKLSRKRLRKLIEATAREEIGARRAKMLKEEDYKSVMWKQHHAGDPTAVHIDRLTDEVNEIKSILLEMFEYFKDERYSSR